MISGTYTHQIPYCFAGHEDAATYTRRYLVFCAQFSMPYRKKVQLLKQALGNPEWQHRTLLRWNTVHDIRILYGPRGFSFESPRLPTLQEASDALAHVYEAARKHLPERP